MFSFSTQITSYEIVLAELSMSPGPVLSIFRSSLTGGARKSVDLVVTSSRGELS